MYQQKFPMKKKVGDKTYEYEKWYLVHAYRDKNGNPQKEIIKPLKKELSKKKLQQEINRVLKSHPEFRPKKVGRKKKQSK